jgi:hypothetical protein
MDELIPDIQRYIWSIYNRLKYIELRDIIWKSRCQISIRTDREAGKQLSKTTCVFSYRYYKYSNLLKVQVQAPYFRSVYQQVETFDKWIRIEPLCQY